VLPISVHKDVCTVPNTCVCSMVVRMEKLQHTDQTECLRCPKMGGVLEIGNVHRRMPVPRMEHPGNALSLLAMSITT